MNDSIPLKALFLMMYALQFLMGPALTYNSFGDFAGIYAMKIDEIEYFSVAISFFLFLQLGFGLFIKNNTLQIDRGKITQWLQQRKKSPYYFIVIGFMAPLLGSLFPSSLNFVFYLFNSFKYIGVFIIISSYDTPKPLTLIMVYGATIISSFFGGLMFHDLLTWLIILGIILAYRYKPRFEIKMIVIVVFAVFASFIQSLKGGLREAAWDNGQEVDLALISETNKSNVEAGGGFFSKVSLGPQIVRINQGWILASTINNVPLNEVHTNGALLSDYLWSAFVPRVFDKEKLNAGDKDIFNKYSGHAIAEGTSMALGLFTDAYVDFGSIGGLVYVFLFGLLYGFIMKQFLVNSKNYPILILFVFLAFIYPIRPDCETQTALGHLIKTCLLLIVVFNSNRKLFKLLPSPL